MNKKIELFFSSPADCEHLTIEVQLDRERVAEINREKGLDHLEIELFGSEPSIGFFAKIPLDDFIKKLIEARELIKKLE